MLKNLIVCAVGVIALAGVIVLILRLVGSARKSPKSSQKRTAATQNTPEAVAQPFSVAQEITFIHSQERLDPEDR